MNGATTPPPDAAIALATDVLADAAIDAERDAAIDAANIDAPVIDAVSRRVDAALVRNASPDAFVAIAAVDAAPPIDAAIDAIVIEHGKLLVVNDTWCEVSIDNTFKKKILQRDTFEVSAGQHVVACVQPGINPGWTKTVEVVGGKTAKAEGSMIGVVDVRFEIDVTIGDASFAKGDTKKLKPGRTNVVVNGQSLWIDIPRVACRLRQDGGRLVCDP